MSKKTCICSEPEHCDGSCYKPNATPSPSPDREAGGLSFGLNDEEIKTILQHGLKPEEISGDPVVQQDRIRELVRWFLRLSQNSANPKWVVPHAYELAYYIATNAGNRYIDLDAIRRASFLEGLRVPDASIMKKDILARESPCLPADKPITLPYVKATDRLPEDGQQIFFRLKRPNQPVKYLAGFFKKDNRPDKTNGGDLSGFTDDRNLYALSININYIDWVDEYSLADKFPSLPVEPEKAQPDPYVEWLDKEIEICRTNWEHHTGMSQPQYWAGRFGSMEIVKEKYLSFRQPQALPIEEGVDLKSIESDAISNLPEYLKDGRDKGRFAWEEGYRAGATNELYSLRTQLQSLISDNDSLRKEAQQLQQDNADDAHRANITIQSLTEERDALKQAYKLQRVELKKYKNK